MPFSAIGTLPVTRMLLDRELPAAAVIDDRLFALAEQAIATLTDDRFYSVYETLHGENWHDGQIGPIVLTWMEHDNRHLGMIEGLVGVQGLHGSADS